MEDLILEAMKKGDFNNLKGFGKPLNHSKSLNPYVDFVTHKLNQVRYLQVAIAVFHFILKNNFRF